MKKWAKAEVHSHETRLGIHLERPIYNKDGEQMFLVSNTHNYYSYDELVKVSEILNDLLVNPEKIKFKGSNKQLEDEA